MVPSAFHEIASECGGEEVGDAANEFFVYVEPLISWFLAHENCHEGVIKEACVSGQQGKYPLEAKQHTGVLPALCAKLLAHETLGGYPLRFPSSKYRYRRGMFSKCDLT